MRGVVEAIDVRLREHPGIADVLFARMQSTDRRLILGIMEILLSAGFSDTDVLLGYAMIHTCLFGRYQVVTRAESDEPAEVDATLARLLPFDRPTSRQGLFQVRSRHNHRRPANEVGRRNCPTSFT